MRAAVVERYGGPEVVRVVDEPRPAIKKGEVLVRVRAAAVTSGDARIRAAVFPAGFALPSRLVFGVFRPRRRVLGSSLSGTVEAVGPGVTQFAPGDRVCGMTGLRMGAHAEFAAVQATRLVHVPDAVSHDDAAAVLFGGTTALHFLRDKGKVGPGMTVLVNGGSGAVGTNAVQFACHSGATVTATCSAANAALVAGLGAHHVVDYRVTPVETLTERFDLVLDTVGNIGLAGGRRLLTERGMLLLAVASLWQTLRARGNAAAGPGKEAPEDFALLLQLVAQGALKVVHDPTPDGASPSDRTLDLADIATAHARVSSGRKVGNVVVAP